jgi:sodium-independent sulfate anion transporter 11
MTLTNEDEMNCSSATIELTKPNIQKITSEEYQESLPTVQGWFKKRLHDPKQQIKNYFLAFFPFLTWIYRYNMTWFWSDLVAGVTVGALAVPESMAFAELANLPPQFGLFTSFFGVMIYWIFGTSKVSMDVKSNYLIILFCIKFRISV